MTSQMARNVPVNVRATKILMSTSYREMKDRSWAGDYKCVVPNLA